MSQQNVPPPLPYATGYTQAVKRPPIIGWWGIIPAIIFVVVEIVYTYPDAKIKATSPGSAPGYLMGHIVGSLLISALLAWAAYGIGRRSTLSGTITFSILLLLLSLSAASHGLDSTATVRPIVQGVMADVAAKQAAANVPLSSLQVVTGTDLQGIDQTGVIETRLSLLKDADEANQQVIDTGNSATTTLDQRLAQSGLRESRRKMIVEQFAQQYQWERGRRIYESNHRLFINLTDFYQFLRDHRGQWQLNPSTNGVDFANADLVEKAKVYQLHIRDELKEQKKLAAHLN